MKDDRKMRAITRDDIDPLATGAWILGTGGGGSPYLSWLNMRRLFDEGAQVKLMSPDELADDDLVAVVSNMGAPLVGQERLSSPEFAVRPVKVMEEYLRRPFRAVMALEIGGGNAFQPLLVAAMSGLPVVDADTMGRAYPEAQMTSFAISDLQMYPCVVSDIRDNDAIVTRAASWPWVERITRGICMRMGSIAATCKAPRTGREVKAFGIHRTATQAIELGRAVLQARARHEDPVAATLIAAQGKMLFRGRITDVARETAGGYLIGMVHLDGLDDDRGSRLKVAFRNEYSVAWRDEEVLVSTPDLICLLDSVSGEAIGTESLRYGQRVSVIALPSAPILRTAQGLRYVGPKAFGFDIPFRSVFDETAQEGDVP